MVTAHSTLAHPATQRTRQPPRSCAPAGCGSSSSPSLSSPGKRGARSPGASPGKAGTGSPRESGASFPESEGAVSEELSPADLTKSLSEAALDEFSGSTMPL